MNKNIIMNNPWTNLNKNNGNIVSRDDVKWINQLERNRKDVFNDLELKLFPEPFIGNPNANIYLLNGNPGFHEDDKIFINDPYFKDAIKKTLKHEYRNSYGDFLYLDEKFEKHPGYKWWTSHLKSLKEAINPDPNITIYPKVFNIEFFPYHSQNLDSLKNYFNSKKDESNWPDWPSFDHTKNLVKEAINQGKIIVIMRLKSFWYKAIKGLEGYKNVIELANPQSVYITENNVRFYKEIKSRSKENWDKLIKNA